MEFSRRRDMDLIRDLLLEIENGKNSFQIIDVEQVEMLGLEAQTIMSKEEAFKYEHHLQLLVDAGFIKVKRYSGGIWHVEELLWAGCDFIDSVRDLRVWAATKDGVAKAGGFSVDLMKALAKGFIKTQIKERTGIEVDF